MSDSNFLSGKTEILTATIASIAAVIAAYFAFQGEQSTADAEFTDTLFNQVEDLRTLVFSQQAEIVTLQAKLAKEHDCGSVLKNYLYQIPSPSWVKLAQPKSTGEYKFTMWYINPAYEKFFGVRKERYIGREDSDIWPPLVAKEYNEDDMSVLEKFDLECVERSFPARAFSKKASRISGVICKWPFYMFGAVAVAGIIHFDSDPTGFSPKAKEE